VRSSHLRQDGGLCFEIPPWQHQPVELNQHLERMRALLGNSTSRKQMNPSLALIHGHSSRPVPGCVSHEHPKLVPAANCEDPEADQGGNQPMCDEERRAARTLASQHVANIYKCIKEARESIAKMGPYAEEMISITRQHMQSQLDDASKSLDHGSETASLGYELDLSVTNARRHSEQSCERLATCSSRARRRSDELIAGLRDQLYQCVYA
ncbi:hypothetical protein MSG28_007150, partial [Choristoneura fumiferana]